MQLNKPIPFTASWKHTLVIGLILGGFMAAIIILLQPFDTYGTEMPYKTLKLSGYALCVLAPVLAIHPLELWRFRNKKSRWQITDEVVALLCGLFLFCLSAFLYNNLIVNRYEINWYDFGDWALHFGLPFAPLFMPLWIYLRFRFGKVIVRQNDDGVVPVSLKGRNQNEQLHFDKHDFVMAHAQANYVDVYLINGTGLKKHTLRTTLSAISEQLPFAEQVHRSYLINLRYMQDLEGNSRKGTALLERVATPVPVSPKYFTALKNHLQTRPKSSK